MSLGYLNLPYESRVIPYDDQDTPVSLIGKKMLPVISIDGSPMSESLDIIRKLDVENKLASDTELSSAEEFIKKFNNPVHSLAMPYWIFTPEFTPSARAYFLQQKEAKRGPFPDLVRRTDTFKQELIPLFEKLKSSLKPFFQNERLTLQDIMIAAHLWGLYVVPEFQFPPVIHSYLQSVKEQCRFYYHQDYWS
jgi:glutaredoxin 2